MGLNRDTRDGFKVAGSPFAARNSAASLPQDAFASGLTSAESRNPA
jgi:hypothetical protein